MKWDPFGKSYLDISNKDLNTALECVDEVRKAVGNEVDLLIEGHGRFNIPTGIKIAKELEQFKPMFFEEPVPPDNLDALKAHYTRGGLGDMKVKRFLNEVLQATLEPIRARRKVFEQDVPAVYDMLRKGSEEAEKAAYKTLNEVKSAMRINYFSDEELIRTQTEKYKRG